MIDDGLFERFPVQEIYGLHNWPGLPVGHFAIRSGPIMASLDEIRIRVDGIGGHAAFPHSTVDPVTVTAALIQAVQTIVSRNVDPLKSAVVSITTIHGGDAFNIIPSTVTLTGTVRTLEEGVRDLVEKRLRKAVSGIADAFEAKAELDYIRNYPVTVNNSEQVEKAVRAAVEVSGAANVITDVPPSMVGEDFAFMLGVVPGAFIFAGNGPSAGLHNPKYDFNDELIPYGCSYWTTLVRQLLA
jgi:hippurate hydrolase